MVGWHHQLNGHEFEQAPRDGEDRESWRAPAHRVVKSRAQLSDCTTATELNSMFAFPVATLLSLKSVLFCQNFHYKMLQPKWCKQQKYIFSHFWRLEVQDQNLSRLGFSLSLACTCPSPHHFLTWHSSVCVPDVSSFLIKTAVLQDYSPTQRVSFQLNHLFEVLFGASLVAQIVKVYACNVGAPGSIPGSGGSPGERNSNPLQCSCVENSVDREALQATVHGVAKSRMRLTEFTSLHFQVLHSKVLGVGTSTYEFWGDTVESIILYGLIC